MNTSPSTSRTRSLAGRLSVATLAASMLATGTVGSAATAQAADLRPRGIDVSTWQGSAINWTQVKASGVSFVFIRASYSQTADNRFTGNWAGAKGAGLYRGAYHYAKPNLTPGSAVAQARYFVGITGRHQGIGDLPPVLDVEDDGGLSQAQLQTWVSTWLTTVESLTGRTPVVYSANYFWGPQIGSTTAFMRYPLWLANYGTGAEPKWPIKTMSPWSFWQYSDHGRVPGIGWYVDLDRFNGTDAELKLAAHPASVPSLTASASNVYKGTAVSLSGGLRSSTGKAIVNAPVTLYRQSTPGGARVRAASAQTSANGAYTFTSTPTTKSSYTVYYPGGVDFAEANSPTWTVDVTVKPVDNPPPTSKYAQYEKTVLQVGSRGATVKVLQQAVHVSADGVFGTKTKAAVVAFQKTRHLPQTGVVNTATWRALGTPAKYAQYEKTVLQVGSRGATVKVLQQAVHVSADGVFGTKTKAAVVAFQKANGIRATGVVDVVTWRALG